MSLGKDLIPKETWEDEDIVVPPTDLWSDEPPFESDLHRQQMQLLIDCLNWWWRERNDFYASGNLPIYYNQELIVWL